MTTPRGPPLGPIRGRSGADRASVVNKFGLVLILRLMNRIQPHPYHLVEVSPWPILMSFTIMSSAFTLVSWFSHNASYSNLISLIPLAIIPILWFRDIIRESKAGYHTIVVQKGITIGFLLFLLSEIMIFFSVFWAFFHSALAPNIE
jgi:cytochrome c oxidase subunit 3